MGLFRRRAKAERRDTLARETAKVAATALPANGRCPVVGVKHHQKDLRKALAQTSLGPPSGLSRRDEDAAAIGWTFAVLFPWAGDAHDPNAIAVFLGDSKRVGWIPANLSPGFRQMILACAYERHGNIAGTCPAYIETLGNCNELLGVRLCCSWPSDVLDDPDQEPEYELPEFTQAV
jgi:hypothetical protein